jgi:hypothetical protein
VVALKIFLNDYMTVMSCCFIYHKDSYLTQHETKCYCWVYYDTVSFFQSPSKEQWFRRKSNELLSQKVSLFYTDVQFLSK